MSDQASVNARTDQVVRRHRDLVLASEDFDRFIAGLDGPAVPVPEPARQLTSLPPSSTSMRDPDEGGR